MLGCTGVFLGLGGVGSDVTLGDGVLFSMIVGCAICLVAALKMVLSFRRWSIPVSLSIGGSLSFSVLVNSFAAWTIASAGVLVGW